MTKKDQYRKRLILIMAMVVFFAAASIVAGGGVSFTKGRCIRAENGSCMIVMENSPVVMKNSTNHKNPFRKYSTGDSLLIIHGPVQETLPGGTDVHWAVKLSGGSIEDVPRDIITVLEDMGWVILKE